MGPGGAHRIVNTSAAETLTYLDCDTVSSPEVVFYPRSGKVGVLVEGHAQFSKIGDDMGYYEGE